MKKSENIIYFKKEVDKYISYFGIFDWETEISEQENKDARATTFYSTCGRIATIYYSEDWISNKKTSKHEISRTAFHECAELFLSKLRDMAEIRGDEDNADEQIHRVIRFMENKIFKS